MHKFFDRYTSFDYVVMAMMAAIGVAIKPFVTVLVHMITGPFMIPGGTVAGGVYMLFLILGAAIVGKRGAAFLISLVEALMVMVTGIMGTHGIMSIVTYALPGIGVELVWFLMRHYGCCSFCCFIGGIVANLLGCFSVNMVFFRLAPIPLIIMLVTAAIAGGLGGLVAWNVHKVLLKYGIVNHKKDRKTAVKTQKAGGRGMLIAVILMVVVLGVCIWLNWDNIQELQQVQENALVRISCGETPAELSMDDVMALPASSFSVIQRSSTFGNGKFNYTGTSLANVLEKAGVDLASADVITVTGADGYTSAFTAKEIKQADSVYLCYYKDGELLGTKSSGGSGPFQLVVAEDVFAQRWVRFVSDITVTVK